MEGSVSEVLAVTDASQVGQARRAAVRLAEASRLSEQARGGIAIIATELATNLARYGQHGRMILQTLPRTGGSCVQMLAIDSGPGIADLQRSMQDGVSTGGTPGTGLGAVRRLSEDFDIHSALGKGTVVVARVGSERKKAAAPAYQWAAISTPAPRETICGDAWRVVETGKDLTVMVADGLGHGPLAAEAANRAAGLFDEQVQSQPAAFCEKAHKALAGSRGAAMAIAHVASGRIRYAGIGNISGSIVGNGKSRGLSSQNGILGVQIRRLQEFEYEWPDRAVLVMHSDGLSSRWSLDGYDGLASRDPALIAGVLFRDCSRSRDDATVVVIKRKAHATS